VLGALTSNFHVDDSAMPVFGQAPDKFVHITVIIS
jgi:hypothetical protein